MKVRRTLPVLLGAAVVVGAAAVAGGMKYNSVRDDLEAQREAIQAQWAQVDQAIQHRANLAPQWISATLTKVPEAAGIAGELAAGRAELSAAGSPADKVRANQRIAVALARYQSIASEHPRLNAHDVLARLSDAENRIAVERRRYN